MALESSASVDRDRRLSGRQCSGHCNEVEWQIRACAWSGGQVQQLLRGSDLGTQGWGWQGRQGTGSLAHDVASRARAPSLRP